VGSVLALAGHITVIFFLVFFPLISGSHFKKRIIEIAGPHLERRRITATIIDDIDAQIQCFLLVRVATAVKALVAIDLLSAASGSADCPLARPPLRRHRRDSVRDDHAGPGAARNAFRASAFPCEVSIDAG
jgi:hypothetical protein